MNPLLGPILLLGAAAATPPAVHEHFGADASPTHVFVVLDAADGRVLRADNRKAGQEEWISLGTGRRFLDALSLLESGRLDPEETRPCDDRCWAVGAHGDVALMNAVAWSCDSYFDGRSPPDEALIAAAGVAGLEVRTEAGSPGTTLLEWAEFWRGMGRSRVPLRSGTLSNLLATAGTTVSSPRGIARALYNPRRTIRVVVGETEDGAWVTGIAVVPGGRQWTFALFLRGGTASLATSRCAHLLQETIRTFRLSTQERGGTPWADQFPRR